MPTKLKHLFSSINCNRPYAMILMTSIITTLVSADDKTTKKINTSSSIEDTSSNSQHKPLASDLSVFVGLSFAYGEDQAFHVDETNSIGEAVGTATFKNPDPRIGTAENIAWYWNPTSGFHIITSRSELIKSFQKNMLTTPFQFYKLKINEKGIVAASFLIDQDYGNQGRYNQCPWFWWSVEDGIHISTIPDVYQIVEDINDCGHVLINKINEYAYVRDIYNEEYYRIVEFPDKEIIERLVREQIPIPTGAAYKNKDFRIDFGAKNAKSIDNNSYIVGEARAVAFNQKLGESYAYILDFEAFERLDNVYISRISELYSKKIIYENKKSDSYEVGVFDSLEPPKWVLFLYQKYPNLQVAIQKSPQDALTLLKFHLFHPDEKGDMCKFAIKSPLQIPIELVKICLPARSYLTQSPQIVDDLYEASIQRGRVDLAQFLFDRDKVEDCVERDNYFVNWFKYEMKKMGAYENETYSEFVNRKDNNSSYILSKLPFELKYGLTNNNFESLCILFRYNQVEVVYYGDDNPSNGIWHDSFSRVLDLNWDARYDPRFWTMLRVTFPSQDYRTSHPEKLDEYLDHIVWKICQSIGRYNSNRAVEALNLLQAEGIDLKQVAKKGKHQNVIESFLKMNGLM